MRPTLRMPTSTSTASRHHYEAAWKDNWGFSCRCLHKHRNLTDAVKCAMPKGAKWHVVNVENDKVHELNAKEKRAINAFKSNWGLHQTKKGAHHLVARHA